jgi:hypothetical protein
VKIVEHINRSPRARLTLENLKETARSYQIKSGMKTFTKKNKGFLDMPVLETNDIIISSFGKHPLELKQLDAENPLKRTAQPLQEAMNAASNGESVPSDNSFGPYRRWMPNRF